MKESLKRMSVLTMNWILTGLIVFILGPVAGIDDSTIAVCFIVFIWLDRIFERRKYDCINQSIHGIIRGIHGIIRNENTCIGEVRVETACKSQDESFKISGRVVMVYEDKNGTLHVDVNRD